MPYKITTLESRNHPIKMKKTDTKATLELALYGKEIDGLNKDFVLHIGLEEIHRPRMWYEFCFIDFLCFTLENNNIIITYLNLLIMTVLEFLIFLFFF